MSRKRGRLVLVGVTGLNLARDEFFKKELTFQVSCSYGPGRYDPQYEDQGIDYPVGYVRWTEQRNFEAILGAMASGQLDPSPLITHRFDFSEAPRAYDLIAGNAPSIGVVLQYPEQHSTNGNGKHLRRIERVPNVVAAKDVVTAGVIGAGNFASRILIPLLKQHGARLRTIVSGGPSGAIAADSFGFERVTTEVDDVLSDPSIDTVFVITRHDTHASFVTRALESGKNVFVEKPLGITTDELEDVANVARSSDRLLMVGFNRRFAPLTRDVIAEVSRRSGPLAVNITVNAGNIPREHWTQNPTVGGGRIVGEGCHFIDLARALVGHEIVRLDVTAASTQSGETVDDVALMSLGFADGSIASISYFANGAKTYPKERVDCFFDGRTLSIDNWRKLHRFGMRAPLFEMSKRQDKGHSSEVEAWMRAVKQGGPAPIPLDELIEVSRWSIAAGLAARRGQ